MPLAAGYRSTIQIQPRDLELLRGLFESRVMTTAHICALYFDGREDSGKKRVQRIASAGLIAQRPRRKFESAVYFLTRGGLDLLRERGVLRNYPMFDLTALERRARVSDLTIRHELQTMDVKTALCRTLKASGVEVVEFTTWPLLNRFTLSGKASGQAEVRPDAFFRLRSKSPSGDSFYLEVDRSTEAQTILVARASAYLAYYRSGGFAVRRGAAREDFRLFPFRVLFVLKTAERRNNTIERLLDCAPPILSQVWLTTFDELIADPLGPIWIRPVDYRDIIAGTEHKIRGAQSIRYARQPRRDNFVETAVTKRCLLEKSNPRVL